METGKRDLMLEHPEGVRSICITVNNKYVATGGRDDVVRVWDIAVAFSPLENIDW